MIMYIQSAFSGDVTLAQWFIGFVVSGLIFSFACYKVLKGKGYCISKCMNAVPIAFIPFVGFIWLIVSACTPQATNETKGVDGEGLPFSAVMTFAAVIIALSAVGFFLLLTKEIGWSVSLLPFFAAIWLSLLLYSKV